MVTKLVFILCSLHMSISSVIFCNKKNSDGIKLNVRCKLSCAAFIGSMPELWVCCWCVSIDEAQLCSGTADPGAPAP